MHFVSVGIPNCMNLFLVNLNLVLSSAEMANQTEDPPIASAEMVGTAFVQQYYTILNQSPHDVYKFYAKESLLSRPESDGSMTTVETVQVSLL